MVKLPIFDWQQFKIDIDELHKAKKHHDKITKQDNRFKCVYINRSTLNNFLLNADNLIAIIDRGIEPYVEITE